jgi:hypothetical protein
MRFAQTYVRRRSLTKPQDNRSMNEQSPATDVQFTRLIRFRQVAYDLYRSSDATAVIAITFFIGLFSY